MPNESIIIVDRNDRIIGAKPRTEVDHNDIYRVAALWLTNSAGHILLAQRAHSRKKNPGLWGPAAAGTVNEGETYDVNMYKEAEEEIGLTGVKFKLGPRKFVHEPDRSRHFTQWHTAQLEWPLHKFRLQTTEVEQIAWVSPADFVAAVASHPHRYVASAPDWQPMFLK